MVVCKVILLFTLVLSMSSAINVREYDTLDCSGEECEKEDSTKCYRTVAVAQSNFCERDGTVSSMMMTCRAGAVVMTKWVSTDCQGTGVENEIKLQSDVCTPFPAQGKALYYDCSRGRSHHHLSLLHVLSVILVAIGLLLV